MDPRFKLDWYKALEWPPEWQKQAKRAVINFWEKNYKPSTNSQDNELSNSSSQQCSNQSLVAVRGSMFDEMYLEKMKKYQKSEDQLSQYLAEPVANIKNLTSKGSLGWWEVNY